MVNADANCVIEAMATRSQQILMGNLYMLESSIYSLSEVIGERPVCSILGSCY